MTGTTFITAYFSGVVLSNATTQNPAAIASGVYIGNTAASPSYNGDAIYGKAGTAWTVVNKGTIVSGAANSSSVGIDLKSGGVVTNASAGSIAGRYLGIRIAGGDGTVANLGTTTASDGDAVYLVAGGRVTNGHSGSSVGLVSASNDGVVLRGPSG